MKQCSTEGCSDTDLATRSSKCKPHHREATRQHYQDNKESYIEKAKRNKVATIRRNRQTIRDWLVTHPCVDCGNEDIEVLQFDHRERSEKLTEVSRLLDGSHGKLCAEIMKCDIRCANCHVKRTRRQMGWWHEADITVTPMLAKALMMEAAAVIE